VCYSLWYNAPTILPVGSLEAPLPGYGPPALQWVHYTTGCNIKSSAPEDERNYRLKHVELIGIINKPLLLHLVGCLYYLYKLCMVKQTPNIKIYLLFITKNMVFLYCLSAT